MPFRDRPDAGRALARLALRYQNEDVVVLGLARGGVPVAFEVARALGAPLDVFVARKIGAPGQEELATKPAGGKAESPSRRRGRTPSVARAWALSFPSAGWRWHLGGGQVAGRSSGQIPRATLDNCSAVGRGRFSLPHPF